VTLPRPLSFPRLLTVVSDLFKLHESHFSVKYQDEEGDWITIATQFELDEHIRSVPDLIRLTIFPSATPIPTSSPSNEENSSISSFHPIQHNPSSVITPSITIPKCATTITTSSSHSPTLPTPIREKDSKNMETKVSIAAIPIRTIRDKCFDASMEVKEQSFGEVKETKEKCQVQSDLTKADCLRESDFSKRIVLGERRPGEYLNSAHYSSSPGSDFIRELERAFEDTKIQANNASNSMMEELFLVGQEHHLTTECNELSNEISFSCQQLAASFSQQLKTI